MNCPSICDEM